LVSRGVRNFFDNATAAEPTGFVNKYRKNFPIGARSGTIVAAAPMAPVQFVIEAVNG
jgi:hypothetical protein